MSNRFLFFLLFFPLSCQLLDDYVQEKNVSKNCSCLKKDTPFLWQEKVTEPFGQLVFSWNSLMPPEGHFVFQAQVRDAESKLWYKLHEMVHWGKNVQRSFHTEYKNGTKYVYVRLELPKGHLADAFRIKVTPRDGASLEFIQQLAAAVSDFSLFTPESAALYKKGYPSVTIAEVPLISQMVLNHTRADTMCSPTSTTMLVSSMIKESPNPLRFAQKVYDPDLDIYGNWLFNVAHAFVVSKGRALYTVSRLRSFAQLHDMLMHNVPVVVSVRGSLPGAPRPSYPSGHLMVVIGYNRTTRTVVCHDPAAPSDAEVVRSYPLEDFLIAWEKSHRLAYCAEHVA